MLTHTVLDVIPPVVVLYQLLYDNIFIRIFLLCLIQNTEATEGGKVEKTKLLSRL